MMICFKVAIGKTDLVEHHIVTTDNIPVNLPSYRLPMHLKSKATDVIDKYLDEGIISPSKSEFSSPLILVKNKDVMMFVLRLIIVL